MGRVFSRCGFSCCFIEVAAKELGFLLVGFKLGLNAGLFELGFLGFLDVLDFFDMMRSRNFRPAFVIRSYCLVG